MQDVFQPFKNNSHMRELKRKKNVGRKNIKLSLKTSPKQLLNMKDRAIDYIGYTNIT